MYCTSRCRTSFAVEQISLCKEISNVLALSEKKTSMSPSSFNAQKERNSAKILKRKLVMKFVHKLVNIRENWNQWRLCRKHKLRPIQCLGLYRGQTMRSPWLIVWSPKCTRLIAACHTKPSWLVLSHTKTYGARKHDSAWMSWWLLQVEKWTPFQIIYHSRAHY